MYCKFVSVGMKKQQEQGKRMSNCVALQRREKKRKMKANNENIFESIYIFAISSSQRIEREEVEMSLKVDD